MQIYLTNEIQIDDEIEVIVQSFPVEVKEKKKQLYLMYTNDEGERIVMKAEHDALQMTRFSKPKTIMQFLAEKEAIMALPTPMGVQHFVTDTHFYHLDVVHQTIRLEYDLKPLEGEASFASYQMEIKWG